MAPAMEENPVTGVKEPYFPQKARISRMLTGSMVIIIMVRPTGDLMELQNFNWSVRRKIMCHHFPPKSIPLPLSIPAVRSDDLLGHSDHIPQYCECNDV